MSLVVGENLRQLLEQRAILTTHGVGGPKVITQAYDETSLTLRLGESVRYLSPPDGAVVRYPMDFPEEWATPQPVPTAGLRLQPRACVLACSLEEVSMPMGYFGLIQTKGSLARLFVSAQCSDGQVDPGYKGRLTFELCNLGGLTVDLDTQCKVAQMFVFRCTTRLLQPYQGYYGNQTVPTTTRRTKP